MGNFMFSFSEGIKGLKRAKISTAIAVLTVSFSIIAFGIFGAISLKFQEFIEFVESKVDIAIFFDETISKTKRISIENQLKNIQGIGDVTYISKEAASEEFKNDFGIDINAILDTNPLPPSYRLKLQKGSLKIISISLIEKQIEQIDGIIDIVNNKDLIVLIAKYKDILTTIGIAIGIILIIASILLVSNTIKLSLLSREKVIATMKLVGATRWFIKRPFVLEGVIQGLLGSILGCGIFYFTLNLINYLLNITIFSVQPIHFGLLVLTGIFLGFIGSIIAMARFLKF